MSKKIWNPICISCGLPFVRAYPKGDLCKKCKRKKEKIYQKEYQRKKNGINR